ncbi:hypothetical protein A2V71_00965 [Candidatus Berkelbacteria bacterium RBG_13_40_8]|uniref:Cohesin domain-containing protein n=1 Tax=Candidatus Berkelbacteria bacterium RBG_13_40_8 TaxID=1797467 RepID=A0A1F5DNW2_9BACT|nr:MAG: hypothetical protein A2V71_00965 [Candidatus Berkelbacteria bacterium RBG_13_40_8]
MKKNTIFVAIGALLLLLLGAFFILPEKSSNLSQFKIATKSYPATLSLVPSSGDFKVGQTFDVQIKVDTSQKVIDGVDIYFLNYDPKALGVVDSSDQEGTQIKAGSILPIVPYNIVDTQKGQIAFSAIVGGGNQGFSGSGLLATITFKVLAPSSSSKVYFDSTAGVTTDSNIVERGSAQEILGTVINGDYTLQ